jgi:hypothetical protein
MYAVVIDDEVVSYYADEFEAAENALELAKIYHKETVDVLLTCGTVLKETTYTYQKWNDDNANNR